jgi:hypothetical protein
MQRQVLRLSVPALVLSLWLATPAASQVVAGWDFSQYAGDGALTIDGVNFVSTLSANYSNFDPTFNAGAESAAFGTLYFDGQFGSTAVPAGAGLEAFLPTAGSLVSNLEAPVQGPGDNPFDSFAILAFEGQLFTQLLSMIALESVNVVFAADLSSVPASGGDWSVSFGAATTGEPTTVNIDFSTDGIGYAPVSTVAIGATDTPYRVRLGTAQSERAFVRFGLQAPTPDRSPILDNVAIVVPEAGAVPLALAALGALILLRTATRGGVS